MDQGLQLVWNTMDEHLQQAPKYKLSGLVHLSIRAADADTWADSSSQ